MHDRVSNTIVDEKAYHEKERARIITRKKKLKKEKLHVERLKEQVLDAKKEEAKFDFFAARERRRMQVFEIKQKEEKAQREAEEKKEAAAVKLRQWRVKYWKEQATERFEEAQEMKRTQKAIAERNYSAAIASTYQEWDTREESRARMQVQAPTLSDPIEFPSGKTLGVFGTPMGPGAYHSADGGHIPGLDQHEVHVFSTGPQTDYESTSVKLIDLNAEIDRTQTLYDSLTRQMKVLDESMERICQLREACERDRRQNSQELAVIDRAIMGPPRRLPLQQEIQAVAQHKNRESQLAELIDDYQHSLDVAERQRRNMEAQSLSLAKSLAQDRQQRKALEKDLNNVNQGFDMMPVIIGRGLASVPGLDATARPLETFNAITQQSKFIGIKNDSQMAFKAHRESVEIDRQRWINKQGGGEVKVDLEKTLNRLAEVAEKIKNSSTETAKLNMIEALKAFQASDNQLTRVSAKLSGPLCWWSHRKPQLCKSIEAFDGGTSLGGIVFDEDILAQQSRVRSEDYDDEPSDEESQATAETASVVTADTPPLGVSMRRAVVGFCVGVVDLPKVSLWSIMLTVSRRGHGNDFISKEEHDYCTIRLGANLSSLQHVGTFFNRINPETGAVLYDVKFLVRGNRLAYRFDFSSAIMDPNKHLAVSAGLYEEYEMLSLESIVLPNGKDRVLSSYVKMIRLEESQGKLRLTKLLEELLSCEDSRNAIWDSEIINNYMQRYSRDYFLRILRAEILIEKNRIAEEQEREISSGNSGAMLGLTGEQIARLKKSQERYVNRRRETQMPRVHAARQLVGKRLDIFDKEKDKWRHVVVVNCMIKWVDDGGSVLIRHTLQEQNDYCENIGGLFEADLDSLRYVETMIQEVDREAIEKQKEYNAWCEQLESIDARANAIIEAAQEEYRQKFEREDSDIQSVESRSFQTLEENFDVESTSVLSHETTQAEILKMSIQILHDIRKGNIEIDPRITAEEQAKKLATERFLHNWKQSQREVLKRRFTRKRGKMKKVLEVDVRALRDLETRTRREAEIERAAVEKKMKKYLEERKERQKKLLKFPTKQWNKVIPRARMCEHMRAKAWGDSYGKGVRCLDCGRELTELHKDESQIMGYGSGTDQWMYEAIKRHRENEQSFRFKDASELQLVEAERVRIEKERRVMNENECYFYDYQDLKAIYDFDRRHAKELKAHGIFRQGLQWTQTELEFFEQTKLIQHMSELEKRGRPPGFIDDFDPLKDVENPPPTFRAEDERRKAQYRELMYTIGRMLNFNKRITGLKRERIAAVSDRALYSEVLAALHQESFVWEHELVELEKDLDKTGLLLSTHARMTRLWERASRVLLEAQREKKRCEMRLCGCWDDVKETQEKLTVLHEETMELLKLKFMYDMQTSGLQTLLASCKEKVARTHDIWVRHSALASAMQYCRPGDYVQCKFGFCKIVQYRPEDQMVLLLLPFCNPPAKLWMFAQEIIHAERARQNGERLLMDIEDAAMKRFISVEENSRQRELYNMRLEERQSRIYHSMENLRMEEEKYLEKSLDRSVRGNYLVVQSEQFLRAHKANLKSEFAKRLAERENDIRNYKGIKAGTPKKYSAWGKWQLKKQLDGDLKKAFIMKAMNRDHMQAKEDIVQQRITYLGDRAVDDIVEEAMLEVVYSIASESIKEGMQAKANAEHLSGLYFSHPNYMQYGTYCLLRDMWKNRKKELKSNIDMGMGLKKKFDTSIREVDPDDMNAVRAAEIRAQQLAEKKRQADLCQEMMKEEEYSRKFYRWELLENLRERRLMRAEEEITRLHMKELEAAAEAAESTYAVSSYMKEEAKKKVAVTSFEKRRRELKDITMERRRIAEECALMALEDTAGAKLREFDKAERMRKLYMETIGFALEEGKVEGQNSADLNALARAAMAAETIPQDGSQPPVLSIVEIPDWLTVPKDFPDWRMAEQKRYVHMHEVLRECEIIRVQNIEKERRLMEVLARKSTGLWLERSTALQMGEWEAELEYMLAVEEAREAEYNLIKLNENVRKLSVFCQQKGEDELRVKTILREKEQIARKRDKELADADRWMNICADRSKKRSKLKRRVDNDCLWVDTNSINGFQQRYRTSNLRERLYWMFFRKIVSSIITRAEIISTERQLMAVQEVLSHNRAQLDQKTGQMKELWRDSQREDLMRMRRSYLNKRFFPRHRRAVLQDRFSSWVRFFLWNRGHREAFELKYELIKRQLDLDRQFKDQLAKKKQQEAQQMEQAATAMQAHRDRPIQCRNCHRYYLESQNTSLSCHYHFGKFQIACPLTCPHPGATPLCIAHKKRRWTCCDSGNDQEIGCARKYHVPPDSDPIYDKVMAKIMERDRNMLESLESQMQDARQHSWPTKALEAKRNMVFAVEDELAKDRATALRINDLKFI